MKDSIDNHPSRHDIRELMAGRLANNDVTLLEDHIASCSTCSSWIAEQEDHVDEFAQQIESALRRTDVIGICTEYEPGTVIDSYRLVRAVGEGGMGTVYLAEQIEEISRRVALKVIKPGMGSSQSIARFETERQTLALMSHANIASVLDAGKTPNNLPYFVMEYVDGIPITEYCDRNRLGLSNRLEFFEAICAAIQHAHQKGIIHRDIKPSNILVSEQDGGPIVKVIDFGVAKATQDIPDLQNQLTVNGQLVGTMAYMSPEQASLSVADVDTQSDVYSLGVLLYELLSGSCPLTSDDLSTHTVPELLEMIRESHWTRPSARAIGCSNAVEVAECRVTTPSRLVQSLRDELDWVALKALESDKTQRYLTADALAEDIRRFLNHKPVEARGHSAAYQIRKFATRHRTLVTTSAIFSILLIASVITSALLAYSATQSKHRALNALKRASESQRKAVAAQKRSEVQQQRAEDEAAIAAAVSAFLEKGILAQANVQLFTPRGYSPEPDLKVSTALDRASSVVGIMFVDQPLVEASIHKTIGIAYRDLGQYDKAEHHLLRSLQMFESHPKDFDAERRLALGNSLSMLYQFQGKYEESLKVTEEGYRIWQELDDPSDQAVVAASNKAVSLWRMGKMSEALPLIETILERIEDRNTFVGITTLHNLATLYISQGNFEAAEPVMLETLERAVSFFGIDNPITITVRSTVGSLRLSQGHFKESIMIHEQVYESRRSFLGEDHPLSLGALANLSMGIILSGEPRRALPIMEEVYQRSARVLGDEHPASIGCLNNLAMAYRRTGQPEKAEPLVVRLIEVSERVHGPEHPMTLIAWNNLSELYRLSKRLKESEEIKLRVLEARERTLGVEHPQTLTALNNLGILYFALKDYDKAESMLRKASRLRTKVLGAAHPETRQAKENLVKTLQAAGKSEEAEQVNEETSEFK